MVTVRLFFCLHGLACVCVAGIVLVCGCASAPLKHAREAFYQNEPEKAADVLERHADRISTRDILLFFMEKGVIFHQAGRYKESVDAFLKAEKLIEKQGIISISRQTASLAINDWLLEYKGEHSERLWVHTYLMMNFLLLGDYESALVEAKQALAVYNRYPEALSDDYFTRALIALCYDNLNEFNDAYIEYKLLADRLNNPSPIAPDLYRLAKQLGFIDEADYYRSYLPEHGLSPDMAKPCELILFVGKGKGPIKISGNFFFPPSIRFSFPRYLDRDVTDHEIKVVDSGVRLSAVSITTSMNAVARAALRDRALKIAAKETARAAVKESMAQAVGRKNDSLVEILVRGSLMILEEPDTRGWETLPAFLTLVRVPLEPGTHQILVVVRRKDGSAETFSLPELIIRNGQKIYCSIRVN